MRHYGSVIVENNKVVSDQETVEERDGKHFILLNDGTATEEVRRITDKEYKRSPQAREYHQDHVWVTL